MTFWQRLKLLLRRGEEPRYVVRNPDKSPRVTGLKKRGIGYTRKDKRRSKACRKMAKASRKINRRRR